jgi:hypothetical protein
VESFIIGGFENIVLGGENIFLAPTAAAIADTIIIIVLADSPGSYIIFELILESVGPRVGELFQKLVLD